MARTTPTVRDGTLALANTDERIAVDSPAWWRWLKTPATRSLRFVHPSGTFTARREMINGQPYWYAYKRHRGKLHKAYLGKPDELTAARLSEVATVLGGRLAAQEPNVAVHPTLAKHAPTAIRPRRTLVERIRLLDRITNAPPGTLVLVVAPAGWGKTTLLSAYAARHAGRTAWVTLEPGDNDPARFWITVITTLRTCYPELGQTALASLQHSQSPDADILPEILVNELTTRIESTTDTVTLVLDDYHLIEHATIHARLAHLLDNLPSSLQLVLTSRTDPPLPLARLRARGQLTEVRAADLRFTPGEARTFFQQVLQLNLADSISATLAERTEGWAAGLQLAGLALQSAGNPAAFLATFSGGHRYIFDYLADEVLGQQSDPVQIFLIQTAILERLSGALCDAVTGRRDSQALLEWLERANLFLVPLDDERRWYRYHHLFHEFLLTRAQQQLTAEYRRVLHRHAATWYATQDDPASAIDHAFAAGDMLLATELVERVARQLWMRSEVLTLLTWVDRLPAALVASRPLLNLCTAWAFIATARPDAAEQHLQAAERVVQGSPTAADAAGDHALRGELAVLRATIARLRDEADQALHWSQRALALLPGEAVVLRGVTMLNLGHAYRLCGEVLPASEAMLEAATLSRHSGNMHGELHALSACAGVQILQGRLHLAFATCRQTVQRAAECYQPHGTAAALAHIRMGDVLREWNRLAEAAVLAERGIALGEQMQNGRIIQLGAATLAKIQQAGGNHSRAAATLQHARELCMRYPGNQWLPAFELAQVEVWLAQGQIDAAVTWAAALGFSANAPPSPDRLNQHEPAYLILAGMHLAQERPAAALALLQPLLIAAEQGQRIGRLIVMLVLQARAYQLLGDTSAALRVLERALKLARPEGYLRVFIDGGTPIGELVLRIYRRTGRRNAYLYQLLQAGAAPPAASATLPEPLSTREQDVLDLLATGLTNRAIADRLMIAPSTVKWHLNHLYAKLGVQSRMHAVARARELGLL